MYGRTGSASFNPSIDAATGACLWDSDGAASCGAQPPDDTKSEQPRRLCPCRVPPTSSPTERVFDVQLPICHDGLEEGVGEGHVPTPLTSQCNSRCVDVGCGGEMAACDADAACKPSNFALGHNQHLKHHESGLPRFMRRRGNDERL